MGDVLRPKNRRQKLFCPKCKDENINPKAGVATCPTCKEVYNGVYDYAVKKYRGPWRAKDGAMLRYVNMLGCCGKKDK